MAEVSLLSLADDVLVHVLRQVGPAEQHVGAGVCKRLRGVYHANATAVKLSRSYDGEVDDAHVQNMARCATLRRVDASELTEDSQPWPLAPLTQLTTMTVPPFWRAGDIPASITQLSVRCTDGLRETARPWRAAMALTAGLRDRGRCEVTLYRVRCGPGELRALSAPWMAGRVFVDDAFFGARNQPSPDVLAHPVLSRLRGLGISFANATDLRKCAAAFPPSLTRLHLYSDALQTLAGLGAERLGGLVRLEVQCYHLTTLRDVAGLAGLRQLKLRRCCSLAALGVPLPGLAGLTALELVGASRLTALDCAGLQQGQLRRLTLSRTPLLDVSRELAALSGVLFVKLDGIETALPFPAGMAQLDAAAGPRRFEFVAPGQQLPRLTHLEIGDHPLVTDLSRLGVETSAHLKSIRAIGAHLTTLDGVHSWDALEEAVFWYCTRLSSVGALSHAPRLTELSLVICSRLTSLRDLGGCSGLRTLTATGPAVQGGALSDLTRLTNLVLTVGSSAPDVHWGGLQRLRLDEKRTDTPALTGIEFIARATQLTSLELEVDGVDSLRALEGLRFLRDVRLARCNSLTTLSPLRGCAHLTRLALVGHVPPGLEHLNGAARLACLELIDAPFQSLRPVARVESLRRLRVSLSPKLTSLKGVERLHRLTALELTDCSALTSMKGLHGAIRLEELSILRCTGLRSLADVQSPPVVDICIRSCPMLMDLQGLPVHRDNDGDTEFGDYKMDAEGFRNQMDEHVYESDFHDEDEWDDEYEFEDDDYYY